MAAANGLSTPTCICYIRSRRYHRNAGADIPRSGDRSRCRAWGGHTFGRYDRVHPRVQRWGFGIQRELGSNMLVEVSYWGQRGGRLFVTTCLDALPAQYWNTTNSRNNAIASNMNQQVTNPFHISNFESLRTSDPVLYQHLSTLGQFTSPTIARNRLLRPFPHMNSLNDSAANTGAARTHALRIPPTAVLVITQIYPDISPRMRAAA